jgi:hypothetical protein
MVLRRRRCRSIGDRKVDPAGDSEAESPSPSPATPGHLRWNTEGLRTHRCTLATASAARQEIILNFGSTRGCDHPGEIGVALLRRIGIDPRTAKQLSAMVQRLVAEHDNRPR